MNSFLLNRAQGSISPIYFHVAQTSRLVQLIEPAPNIHFASSQHVSSARSTTEDGSSKHPPDPVLSASIHDNILYAHGSGVNVLAIDPNEGRYMVSGGADPSIHLWDLEGRGSELDYVHRSIASINKSSHESAHTHAITSISIYPFDPTPSTIFSTSYDGTLKLSALQPAVITPAHTFTLDSTPYTHSFSSHPSSTLLVAVGTSEKSVRLLDLRSGLSTHGLPGHSSSILSVSWAPHNPHILASASTDNRVIIFDVRRSGNNSAIATLDMDDAVGVIAPGLTSSPYQGRQPVSINARAHNGAVTGVRWTSNGSHLVTAGQDSRIRVWNATTGANTLTHFGPRVRNGMTSHVVERAPLILPVDVMFSGHETLLWPNFSDGQHDKGEIFMFELREGTFIKCLKVPGLISRSRQRQQRQRGRSTALTAARINALAWRGNGASGEGIEMFSAHGDGTIKAWASRVPEEVDETVETELDERKRKRDVLEEIYHSLTSPSVRFS